MDLYGAMVLCGMDLYGVMVLCGMDLYSVMIRCVKKNAEKERRINKGT